MGGWQFDLNAKRLGDKGPDGFLRELLTSPKTADTPLWVRGMDAWRKTGRGSPSHYSRTGTLTTHATWPEREREV